MARQKLVKFDGKNWFALSGAVMVYLNVPFHRTAKREQASLEDSQLDELYWRISRASKAVYPDPSLFSSRKDLVAARLATEATIEFSPDELELLTDVVRRVIAEWGDGPTMSVYFNGGEYGIEKPEFEDLLRDLEAESNE